MKKQESTASEVVIAGIRHFFSTVNAAIENTSVKDYAELFNSVARVMNAMAELTKLHVTQPEAVRMGFERLHGIVAHVADNIVEMHTSIKLQDIAFLMGALQTVQYLDNDEKATIANYFIAQISDGLVAYNEDGRPEAEDKPVAEKEPNDEDDEKPAIMNLGV